MKKTIFTIVCAIIALSCTKENTEDSKIEQSIPINEFESLKQEVEKLKIQLEDLTSREPSDVSTIEEINALKRENEELKTQISLFTSGFFEVDGLRFDKNGTLISVAKLEKESTQIDGDKTLTTTRTYDGEGRLIQIYRKYSGGNSINAGSPYYWQKVIYEYNGMSCKVTTQTNKYGLPAGTPYEEKISEATYW